VYVCFAAAQHHQRGRKHSSVAQKRQQAASAGRRTKPSEATAGIGLPQGSGRQQQQQQQLSQQWRNQQRREQWQQADSRGSLDSDWQQEVRRRRLAWPSRQQQRLPRQRRHLQQAAQRTSSASAAQPARQRTAGGSRWRTADEVGCLSMTAPGGLAPFCRLRAATLARRTSSIRAQTAHCRCSLCSPMWRCSLPSRQRRAKRRLQTSSTACRWSTKCALSTHSPKPTFQTPLDRYNVACSLACHLLHGKMLRP
jgi:hypothetical protein